MSFEKSEDLIEISRRWFRNRSVIFKAFNTIIMTSIHSDWSENKKKSLRRMTFSWWFQAESNRRHKDFQSFALPTELQNQWLRGKDLNQRPPGYGPDELPGCSTSRFDERIWRRSRDSNPGASFPTYRFSRPDPSTTWVLLHSGP